MRKRLGAIVTTAALAAAVVAVPTPSSADVTGPDVVTMLTQRATLWRYAADTWRSFVAMVDPVTGVPADKVTGDLKTRAKVTSPTNIGTYLWSVMTARDIGLISSQEATSRASKVLAALQRMDYHKASGQFYNWYDPSTLELVHVWPENGDTVRLFASSVDNSWIASALMMTRTAFPSLRDQAQRILSRMDFASYYHPDARPDAGTGLMRGGFWVEKQDWCTAPTTYKGETIYATCHDYGSPSETRMVSYVAIALGQVPAEHYFGIYRTFPDQGCDWSWQDSKPTGSWKEYMGVKVWQGTYSYRGMRFVPNWGGSMFEELMPNLVVPEEKWGRANWGRNHPVFVKAQIEHGLNEAKYGYWGFSPSNNPDGGYREYGVDALGMFAEGYTSDQERTQTDPGYAGCRDPQPAPSAYGDGVVTPHASFLALRYAPKQALDNLAKLKKNFNAYGSGGFYDAIAVRSGKVSEWYLALDQGMIMAALGNALAFDNMRRYFATPEVTARLKPLLRLEEWDVRG